MNMRTKRTRTRPWLNILRMRRMPEKLPEEHCRACCSRGFPAVNNPHCPTEEFTPCPARNAGAKAALCWSLVAHPSRVGVGRQLRQ